MPSEIQQAIHNCAKGREPWPLLLSGSVGIGKTYAGLVLCDWVAAPTLFYTLGELCNHLIACQQGTEFEDDPTAIRPRKITPPRFWISWAKQKLCIIDEIGQRKTVSDHHYETLKTAIDRREGKALMLIANMDLGGIAELYDDRIASRLASGTALHVLGKDRRLAMHEGETK